MYTRTSRKFCLCSSTPKLLFHSLFLALIPTIDSFSLSHSLPLATTFFHFLHYLFICCTNNLFQSTLLIGRPLFVVHYCLSGKLTLSRIAVNGHCSSASTRLTRFDKPLLFLPSRIVSSAEPSYIPPPSISLLPWTIVYHRPPTFRL